MSNKLLSIGSRRARLAFPPSPISECLHKPAACRGRLMCLTGDLAGDRLSWSSFWQAALGGGRGSGGGLVLKIS